METRQIFIDVETTGLSAGQGHRIIELAAIETVGGTHTGKVLHSFFNPERDVDPRAERVHGMSYASLMREPKFAPFAGKLIDFVRGAECLIHNAPFDTSFIDAEFERAGRAERLHDICRVTCTLRLARTRFPGESGSLDSLAHRAGIKQVRGAHSAREDATLLADAYFAVLAANHSTRRQLGQSRHTGLAAHARRITPAINHHALPTSITTRLAWQFFELLPGSFKRNKAQFAHHDYPIIAPLPTMGPSTRPLEECAEPGPFIYFVLNRNGVVCYVGKSQEKCVLQRWIRPDNSATKKHYWTHSTREGGNVFRIAEGLRNGDGPFALRYTTLRSLFPQFADRFGINAGADEKTALARMEKGLIDLLKPQWNA